MRKLIAALGLAALLSGCSAIPTRVVSRYRDCVQPQIRYTIQDNSISVPTLDWELGDRRYLDLNTSEFGTPGMRTRGRIPGHDWHMYDIRMDLVDSNNDSQYDLVRVTLNSEVMEHPDENLARELMLGRTMIQDRDYDGTIDAVWSDHLDDDGTRGMDGQYDVMLEDDEIRYATIREYIDHWLIFVPPG